MPNQESLINFGRRFQKWLSSYEYFWDVACCKCEECKACKERQQILSELGEDNEDS